MTTAELSVHFSAHRASKGHTVLEPHLHPRRAVVGAHFDEWLRQRSIGLHDVLGGSVEVDIGRARCRWSDVRWVRRRGRADVVHADLGLRCRVCAPKLGDCARRCRACEVGVLDLHLALCWRLVGAHDRSRVGKCLPTYDNVLMLMSATSMRFALRFWPLAPDAIGSQETPNVLERESQRSSCLRRRRGDGRRRRRRQARGRRTRCGDRRNGRAGRRRADRTTPPSGSHPATKASSKLRRILARTYPSDRGPATVCFCSRSWRPSSIHVPICGSSFTSSGHCRLQYGRFHPGQRGGRTWRMRDQTARRSCSSPRARSPRTPPS
jgi:hypothetical protein